MALRGGEDDNEEGEKEGGGQGRRSFALDAASCLAPELGYVHLGIDCQRGFCKLSKQTLQALTSYTDWTSFP